MAGEQIRALRQQRGLSREKLAQQLGISATAVYKWECGLSEPSSANLQRMAALFRVSLDELASLAKPMDDQVALMCRAMEQMSPEDRERLLAVGRALFAEVFREAEA